MQQGRICILGIIEFPIDNENADKNAQVKLYFMPELKVILYLWKKIRHPKNNKKQKKFEHKIASPAKRSKCRYDFVAFTWRTIIKNRNWIYEGKYLNIDKL